MQYGQGSQLSATMFGESKATEQILQFCALKLPLTKTSHNYWDFLKKYLISEKLNIWPIAFL